MADVTEYAELFRLIARSAQIQWQAADGSWVDQLASTTLYELAQGEFPPERYREKPSGVQIGETLVPRPLSLSSLKGLPTVYSPNFGLAMADDMVTSYATHPQPDAGFQRLLNLGLLHDSREAAARHARALVSFTDPSY